MNPIRAASSALRSTALIPGFLLLACLASGCRTGYWADRGRDAADMGVLTAGIGAGAGVQAGPCHLGVIATSDFAGLRHGEFFARNPPRDTPDTHDTRVLSLVTGVLSIPLVALSEGWGGLTRENLFDWPAYSALADDVGNGSGQGSVSIVSIGSDGVQVPDSVTRVYGEVSGAWKRAERLNLSPQQLARGKGRTGPGSAAAWRLEACAGLGLTVRAGVNFAEILDFALGWFGLDPVRDDLSRLGRTVEGPSP